MLRRQFLFAGAGALVAARAWAQPVASVNALARYGERLRARIEDGGGGRFVLDIEAELVGLHDDYRRAMDLGPLQPHRGLAAAARAHAADQMQRRFFAHASPEGFQAEHRVGLIARSFVGLPGENLVEQRGSWRSPPAERFMRQWIDSPGHRANIERASYTHVGFGSVQNGQRTVAVAVFGQRFAELPEPAPFELGGGEALGRLLQAADPPMPGYNLTPVGGQDLIGPFPAGQAPARLARGAYVLRPRIDAGGGRYAVVYGPIVAAG